METKRTRPCHTGEVEDLLGGVLVRLETTQPRLRAYREESRSTGRNEMAELTGRSFVSEGPSPSETRTGAAEICAVYGVQTMPEALERYGQDRAVLRGMLTETACLLAEETLHRMVDVLEQLSIDRFGSEEPPTPTSGPPIDRFARALAAWLVHTSPMPFPALREDLPMWRTSELGPPPGPGPAPVPGGTPDPPRPEEPWNVRDRGIPPWRPYGGENLAVEHAQQLFNEERPEHLRKKLLASEVGGFPYLLVVRHLRNPVQIYELLREEPTARREGLRALISEIESHLVESMRSMKQALRRTDGGDGWRTLLPLLEMARGVWCDPAGNPGLWAVAGEEIDAINSWTLEDKVQLGLLLVSAILVLVSWATPAAPIGVVVGGAAVVGAVDTAYAVGTLLARRAESDQINRFAEIDASLAVAESVESIDSQLVLVSLMTLVPHALRPVGRVALMSVRGLSRRLPDPVLKRVASNLDARVQVWMRQSPAPTAPPPARGRAVQGKPPKATADAPPDPTSRASVAESVAAAPPSPAAGDTPSVSLDAPKGPSVPDPPSGVDAASPPPQWPLRPLKPARPKRGEEPEIELSPELRAEMEAHSQAQLQRFASGDPEIEDMVGNFDSATRPRVKWKERPTIEGRGISTRDVNRLDVEDIARLPGESISEAVTRVRQVIGQPVSETPLANAWEEARKKVLAGRNIEDLGRQGAIDKYPQVRAEFWAEVRKDRAALEYLERAGYVLNETGAPLLRVTRDLPEQEIRVSLDHSAEKALGTNWRRALDADNLVLEFQNPNTWRDVVQRRHRMRDDLGPDWVEVPIGSKWGP